MFKRIWITAALVAAAFAVGIALGGGTGLRFAAPAAIAPTAPPPTTPPTRTRRPTSTRLPLQPTSTPEPIRPTPTATPRYSTIVALPSTSDFEFDGEFKASDWEQCGPTAVAFEDLTSSEIREANIESHEGRFWASPRCDNSAREFVMVEAFVSGSSDEAILLMASLMQINVPRGFVKTETGAKGKFDDGSGKIRQANYYWSTYSKAGESASAVLVRHDRVVISIVTAKPRPLTEAQCVELAQRIVERIERAKY